VYQYSMMIGNVGRNPEMRYTQAGKPVADFSLAVNRRWKNAAGEEQEKTTWFRVSCWGALAEVVNQYVHKGMLIMVSGEVDGSAWLGSDGEPKCTLELTARDVKFLSRANGGHENPEKPETALNDIPF